MSYSRWSDDDFQCDVYVYQSSGDDRYDVAVRGSKVIWDVELPPVEELTIESADRWASRTSTIIRWLEDATKWHSEPIELEQDQWLRIFDTPGGAADWLDELVSKGVRVPEDVIPTLRKEQQEQEDGPTDLQQGGLAAAWHHSYEEIRKNPKIGDEFA